MVEFHYQEEYSDRFGVILRPLAPILITNKGKSIFAAMYIDSGADVTMIPLRAGKDLGFVYEPQKVFKMRGISGTLSCILEQAELGIGEKKVIADVTWAMSDDTPFLLGRRHIFENFRIIFEEAKRKIFFESLAAK